ncbi:SCO-spondin-like isoform X2 [Dreissena polymorpha]|uniref:Sodefrin-like factor n=1 Tax=Dreissena polymorpha TaxID=45954 RepID=A0A9D4FCJ2_DREPO|nr:SCO-spondin-like isoform X2 [Dreissena polymorpha]KAH3796479.1 hypothetical protein DPMN_150047 [Dreissena polymorpha]
MHSPRLFLLISGLISLAIATGPVRSNCCHCDDLSPDPARHCSAKDVCKPLNFDFYCEIRRLYINGEWKVTRGNNTEEACLRNWVSSVVNPDCSATPGSTVANGTACYQCCTSPDSSQYNYCNENPDAHVTFPTPSTIRTTTPVTSTSTPLNERSCEVCGLSLGLQCRQASVTQCGEREPYCMNTVISEGDNATFSVRKTCATEAECFYDSHLGSQDSPHCSTLPGAIANKGACHYCCKSSVGASACNTNTVPDVLAKFDQHGNHENLCEVGITDGGFKNTSCPPSTPMCMNTVVRATNVSYTKKTCETRTLCNTDWWEMTRKHRPQCMTSNVTSIPVTSEGLVCHYCCESKNFHPCNNDTVPSDVVEYINLTKPIDGGWSAWTQWTSCTALCKGNRVRTRSCTNPPPSNGGATCLGEKIEDETCGSCPDTHGPALVG